jgi:hypothetical protein
LGASLSVDVGGADDRSVSFGGVKGTMEENFGGKGAEISELFPFSRERLKAGIFILF